MYCSTYWVRGMGLVSINQVGSATHFLTSLVRTSQGRLAKRLGLNSLKLELHLCTWCYIKHTRRKLLPMYFFARENPSTSASIACSMVCPHIMHHTFSGRLLYFFTWLIRWLKRSYSLQRSCKSELKSSSKMKTRRWITKRISMYEWWAEPISLMSHRTLPMIAGYGSN